MGCLGEGVGVEGVGREEEEWGRGGRRCGVEKGGGEWG